MREPSQIEIYAMALLDKFVTDKEENRQAKLKFYKNTLAVKKLMDAKPVEIGGTTYYPEDNSYLEAKIKELESEVL